MIGYYHPYDPSSFALDALGTYGSTSDISTTVSAFDQIDTWSKTNNIPVTADEMGAENACDYNSRMIYYATMVEQAISRGESFNIWDDNGYFQTYIRDTRKWDDSKDVIIHTYKESPTQLKAVVNDTTVSLSWLNRTTLNDSIILDRRTNLTDFAPIAKLDSTSTQFHDSALIRNTIYYYRLRTRLKDSIDLYSYPVAVNILGIRKPYLGYPLEVPGIIQAEDFDLGGLDVAYYTSDNINQGGAYRPTEGVGIEARPDSGYQLDYVSNGEWVSYTIHVKQKALYRIDVYTASQDGGGTYNFKIGTETTKTVSVPKTNDWTTLAVSSTYAVSLDTGVQVLYFNIISGTNTPFNIDRFVFTVDSSASINSLAENQDKFQVCPNPASSLLTIQKSMNGPVTLEIFNMLGLKIKTEILYNDKNIVSFEGIRDGIYLLILKSGNFTETKKVIIKH